MAGNRIYVFLRSEDPARTIPQHQSSKLFADILVSSVTARWLDPLIKKKLLLLTNETWLQVKTRFRGTVSTVIPVVLPPREPECLMLSYPPQNYESNGAAKQRQLWLNAVRF